MLPRPPHSNSIRHLAQNNQFAQLKELLLQWRTKLNHHSWSYFTRDYQVENAACDAILAGHEDIVRLLLDAGLPTDARTYLEDIREFRPLIHFAAKSGRLNMVKLLIEYDPSSDKKERNLEVGLKTAVLENHVDIVDYLLNCGADPNDACETRRGFREDKTFFLAKAAEEKNIPLVESLVQHGANIPLTLTITFKQHREKYQTELSALKYSYNDEMRISKIENGFTVFWGNSSKFLVNYSKTPKALAFFAKLNTFLKDVTLFQNNENEKSKFLQLFETKCKKFNIIVRDKDELKRDFDNLLNTLDEFDRKKLETQQKADDLKNSYKRIVSTCLDYAMGSHFEEENGLSFLADLDISGMNFIGISVDNGVPVTQAMLEKAAKSGAKQAIVTIIDLMAMKDETRKNALSERLNVAFAKKGKLVDKAGIVNLVPLIKAATNGDIAAVNARLQAGEDPNLEEGAALLAAAKKGHTEVVKSLFEAQAHCDKSKTVVVQAIEDARNAGHSAIVEFLEENQDVNHPDKKGNTLLHKAAQRGDVNRVNELLRKGAEVNVENQYGETPLNLAVQHSRNWNISKTHSEVIAILLAHHADPDKYKESSPLELAVKAGNVDAVAMLLPVTTPKDIIRKDYSSNEEKDAGTSPWYVDMMFEALRNKEAIPLLTLLKNYGADFNEKNQYGSTLLIQAVHALPSFSHIQNRVDDLVLGGYNVERIGDVLQRTKNDLIDNAQIRFKNALTLFDFLLANGADPRIGMNNGQTPLAYLIKKQDLSHINQAAELLMNRFVQHGANVNAADDHGFTPLYEAVRTEDLGAIEYLLNHGAMIDHRDQKNRTPLHHAALCGNKLSTKMLLEKGADFTLRDEEGLTALELAAKIIADNKNQHRSWQAQRNFEAQYVEVQTIIREFIANRERKQAEPPLPVARPVQRQVTPSSTAVALNEFKAPLPVVENKPEEKLPPILQAYVDSFKHKPEMNLELLEEDAEFKECYDPITLAIPKIPVRVNKHLYGLQSLLQLPQIAGIRKDPLNRQEFSLQDIQPAEDIQQKIEDRLRVIQAQQKPLSPKVETNERGVAPPATVEVIIDQELVGGPGGPNNNHEEFVGGPGGPNAPAPEALVGGPGGPNFKLFDRSVKRKSTEKDDVPKLSPRSANCGVS